MTKTLDIDSAFRAAQTDFLKAQKTGKNPHLKSDYSTLRDVQDAVYPALHEHGFSVIFGIVWDEAKTQAIGVECRLSFGADGSISTICPIIVGNNMQQLGSAITYAKRYALIAITGVAIDDGTDDDGQAAKGRNQGGIANNSTLPPPAPEKPSVKRIMSDIGKARLPDRLDEIEAYVNSNANTSKEHLLECIQKRRAELGDPYEG